MENTDITALRATLIKKESQLRMENRKIESKFKANCGEIESIRRQLQDLKPIL